MPDKQYECWLLDIFEGALLQLKRRVLFLMKHRENYLEHPDVKLFLGIVKVIRESSSNPDSRIYRLGKTLGEKYPNWRRCKKHGLPQRYRLFFQFRSFDSICIYAWINDEKTLRKEDGKTDVYAMFKALLQRGIIPSGFEALFERSTKMKADIAGLPN